jgi:hypothetical protein
MLGLICISLFREYPVQSYWFGVTVGKSSSVTMNIIWNTIVLAWFIIAGNFVSYYFLTIKMVMDKISAWTILALWHLKPGKKCKL